METKKITLTSEIPMTYNHINLGPGKPLLMVFHGYTDSSSASLRRMYPDSHNEIEILAPNGIFPIPAKRGEVWKPAYAWYFADFSKNSVLIHPEISAKAVDHLLTELNLQDRPKILLGFSQGVFFLPFLLPKLKNVKHIFAVGAAYREEDYSEAVKVPFDAIHGTDDDVIPFGMAEKSFQNFVNKKCASGQFHSFQGLKHTMNDDSRLWLKNKIESVAFDLK